MRWRAGGCHLLCQAASTTHCGSTASETRGIESAELAIRNALNACIASVLAAGDGTAWAQMRAGGSLWGQVLHPIGLQPCLAVPLEGSCGSVLL